MNRGTFYNYYLDRDISDGIDAELLAGYRAHASFGLIVEWVNGGFKYSLSYMAEQLVRILIASGERDEYRVHIE